MATHASSAVSRLDSATPPVTGLAGASLLPCVSLARSEDAGYEAFIEVGRRVYAAHAHLIPSSELATARALSGRGPRAGRADWRLFVVPHRARTVAILNRELSHDVALGQVGYFEAADDEAARRVLEEAMQWLRLRRCRGVVGPMDFDIYGRYRLKTAFFDAAPHVAEPHNPQQYPAIFESLGFTARRRWRSVEVPAGQTAHALDAALTEHRDALAGYSIRPLAPERMEAELRCLHELVSSSFSRFDLYSGLTWDDFLAVFSPWRPYWDPQLVLFALAPDGKPCGFALALPDVGRRLRAMQGRTGLMARARYAMTRADRGRCIALYVSRLPGAPRGLGLMLAHAIDARAKALGYRTTVHALVDEQSPALRYAGADARPCGEYALYERAL
jgi:hypothetical protein